MGHGSRKRGGELQVDRGDAYAPFPRLFLGQAYRGDLRVPEDHSRDALVIRPAVPAQNVSGHDAALVLGHVGEQGRPGHVIDHPRAVHPGDPAAVIHRYPRIARLDPVESSSISSVLEVLPAIMTTTSVSTSIFYNLTPSGTSACSLPFASIITSASLPPNASTSVSQSATSTE